MAEPGNENPSVAVLGVPFCGGQPKAGADDGPKAVRDTGVIKTLQGLDWNVKDNGDIGIVPVIDDSPSGNVKHPRFVGTVCKKLSDAVGSIAKSGDPGIVIGGDHSLAIGSIHGHMHAKKNVCVVWVDAHADLNPPLASESGNIHGMPLSFLVHEIQKYIPKLPGFEWVKPCLHTKDLAYIALRDVDPAERKLIEEHNIACYSMHEVDKYGIQKVVEMVLNDVNPKGDRPIHLSFDIDALDPFFAPSTGTPVAGGLTLREGQYIAEELANTGQLMMVDLVEVNPKLGTEADAELTAASASHIIASCFGKKRQGNVPKGYVIPIPQ